MNDHENNLSGLAERLNQFFQLVKTTENEDKIIIKPELMNDLRKLDNVLEISNQLALREPIPDKHLILMTNASFQG